MIGRGEKMRVVNIPSTAGGKATDIIDEGISYPAWNEAYTSIVVLTLNTVFNERNPLMIIEGMF